MTREPGNLPLEVVLQPDGVGRMQAKGVTDISGAAPAADDICVVTAGSAYVKEILLPVCLFAGTPALAQDPSATGSPGEQDLLRITVLATGTKTRVDQSGQSITILEADEIEAAQGVDVTRVLERVPGLVFSRNGGPGSFTGVRLRGADAEQALVLIDGVRVEDVSAPSGGFDFGTLFPGEIERIDVLRGSNSVAWGSAAMGGVIAITSKSLSGAQGSLEYGSHDTFSASAAAGLESATGHLTLSGGHARSDGISAARDGTEPDGFSNWRAGLRGRLNLAPGLGLVASGRYSDTRTDIDGYAPPTFAFGDTPEFQKTRQASGYAGFEYGGDTLTLASGVALSNTDRDYFNPDFSDDSIYGYSGRGLRWNLNGALDLAAETTLYFGGDREWTRYSGTFDALQKTGSSSAHAQIGQEFGQGTLVAGLRLDDHAVFGSEWTAGANGTWIVRDGVRLRASYGEGFKAPTLFQLLSDYGNEGLQPESSRSFDLGIDLGSGEAPFRASATAFRRTSRNLIVYVSCDSLDRCTDRPFGLYDNIARARGQGVEMQLHARPVNSVILQLAYSYTNSENRTVDSDRFGNMLPRRPRHAATLAADVTPVVGGASVGADLRWVSSGFDDADNFVSLGNYVLAALRASAPLGENLELYGRIENLFDTQYETAAGYGTWGRAVFAGVRISY